MPDNKIRLSDFMLATKGFFHQQNFHGGEGVMNLNDCNDTEIIFKCIGNYLNA